jgi:hypothetical protein
MTKLTEWQSAMLEKHVGDEMIRARKSNWPSDRLNDLATGARSKRPTSCTPRPSGRRGRSRATDFCGAVKAPARGTPIRPPESQRPPLWVVGEGPEGGTGAVLPPKIKPPYRHVLDQRGNLSHTFIRSVLNRLSVLRGPGESYRDVILRLANG